MPEHSGRIDRGDGVHLAWTRRDGRAPMVVFLPGFASDMAGSKAMALDAACAARGQAMLRLDYSGHGQSGGAFADGCIGRWHDDARCVIDHAGSGALLLVGSSMGGWIALLLARALGERVAGLVGIAAAPDFTFALWHGLPPEARAAITRDGHIDLPGQYGAPLRITRALIEDGARHLLLDAPIPVRAPVRLLHGQQDPDVPWQTSLRLAERLDSADVHVTLIKDGDHRLSRPADLALLGRTVFALLGQDGA